MIFTYEEVRHQLELIDFESPGQLKERLSQCPGGTTSAHLGPEK